MGLSWLSRAQLPSVSPCRAQRAGGSEYRRQSAHPGDAVGPGRVCSKSRGWGLPDGFGKCLGRWLGPGGRATCSTVPRSPQAAYLQRAGLRTAVLEKRHVLGGAAVTEEIVPGTPTCPTSSWPLPAPFYSSAPRIFQALSSPGHPTCSACCGRRSTASWSCRYGARPQLGHQHLLAHGRVTLLPPCLTALRVSQRHGLRVLPRDPYSFTPLLEDRSPPRSLLLGHDMAQTQRQIAQFSQKDAQVPQGAGQSKAPRSCPAPWSSRDARGGVSFAPSTAQSLLATCCPLPGLP